jgi:hypothetical protein
MNSFSCSEWLLNISEYSDQTVLGMLEYIVREWPFVLVDNQTRRKFCRRQNTN